MTEYCPASRLYTIEEVDGIKGITVWYHNFTVNHFLPVNDNLIEGIILAIEEAYKVGQRDKVRAIRKELDI